MQKTNTNLSGSSDPALQENSVSMRTKQSAVIYRRNIFIPWPFLKNVTYQCTDTKRERMWIGDRERWQKPGFWLEMAAAGRSIGYIHLFPKAYSSPWKTFLFFLNLCPKLCPDLFEVTELGMGDVSNDWKTYMLWKYSSHCLWNVFARFLPLVMVVCVRSSHRIRTETAAQV